MFKIALELPFHVMLVHKKIFTTPHEAAEFLAEHYASFPAFEIYPEQDVNAMNAHIFLFPVRWDD